MDKIKVAVYGYGESGKKVIGQLECNEIEIVGVIDNNLKESERYHLWTAETFIKESVEVDYVVFAMKYHYEREKLIRPIKDAGYSILMVPNWYFWYGAEMNRGIKFLDEDCIPIVASNLIDIMEFVIQDGCNMNCKGCTQFSPLFKEDEHVDLATFTSDIRQFKKICPNVMRIQILGGEIFLLNNLDEYLQVARETFPEAQINILSNGLLLPQMSKKVIASIRNNGIIVNLTSYLPTLKMIDIINEFAADHGIVVTYSKGVRDKFSKFLLSKKLVDGGECTCNIPAIYRGRVAVCSAIMVMQQFNNCFNTNFPEDGAVDLYDSKMTLERLREIIYKKAPLCDYCILRTELRNKEQYNFNWDVYGDSLPQKEDWIYKV